MRVGRYQIGLFAPSSALLFRSTRFTQEAVAFRSDQEVAFVGVRDPARDEPGR